MTFRRKADYRPELAWTWCDYADTLNERDAEGDRARAITLLDEALAIATELGMPPLIDRVTGRLERVQVPSDAAPAYPGGLTEREEEVHTIVS